MIPFLIILASVLALMNVITVLLLLWKLKKSCGIAEEQKFKMAEANLTLLEQREALEEQKFKMADANLKLLELNEIIEMERARSEKLLLNILPQKVAESLKENGKTEPELYHNVTVFFSDIVGFTEISSMVEPPRLIAELNEIFTEFDHIFKRHSCERIKTIGDAYLAVCGIPDPSEKHASNIAESAIEIMRFMEKRAENSEIKWRIRAGIHSGSVVAGVVGIEKYIYDVFGDTINTASRMESNSEPMKINVSSASYELLKDKFKFIRRPQIQVKGKGVFEMYFLDHQDSL